MDEGESTYRDPVVEAYKKDLDRTFLRANLKLTVTERFQRAMAPARLADELRRAGRELRANGNDGFGALPLALRGNLQNVSVSIS